AVNADFSARVFLLFVKFFTIGILLKPFSNEIYSGLKTISKRLYNQMQKNSDSWKKEPDDINKNL
ncbi:MAG: hypothetical protein KC455_12195, partial [Carnobacterium sp.]|nr:hypothetical protein [Carnobacterium sp.]